MKTLIQTLLVGLSVITSACSVEVAELRDLPIEPIPTDTAPEPMPSSPIVEGAEFNIDPDSSVLDSVVVIGGHCVGFATGPRTVVTAAHCIGGVATTITHPVTGNVIPLTLIEADFRNGNQELDRAKFMLPEKSPNMKHWFEVAEPTSGELAVMFGKRNKHYLLLQVESLQANGQWRLKSLNGVDAYPGDSGSPVVSLATGKVIGTLSSFGPALTPVVF